MVIITRRKLSLHEYFYRCFPFLSLIDAQSGVLLVNVVDIPYWMGIAVSQQVSPMLSELELQKWRGFKKGEGLRRGETFKEVRLKREEA